MTEKLLTGTLSLNTTNQSPIPRKGILAVVNCQLLVEGYEMEIDSAEN